MLTRSAADKQTIILKQTYQQTTELALRSFQACEGLPETGSAYAAVWEALLPGGGPEDLVDLAGSQGDLNRRGVYLLGEGRWEKEAAAP